MCAHTHTHTHTMRMLVCVCPFYQGLVSCFYIQLENCAENCTNFLVHPLSFRTGTSSCFLNTTEAVTMWFNNDLTHACLNIKPTSTMHHEVQKAPLQMYDQEWIEFNFAWTIVTPIRRTVFYLKCIFRCTFYTVFNHTEANRNLRKAFKKIKFIFTQHIFNYKTF